MRSKRTQNKPSEFGPDDELDFADGDLLQLAARLGAEANQLATVYPPKEDVLGDGRRDAFARRRWSRTCPTRQRLWWVGTCSAVALALGLGVPLLRSPSDHLEQAAPNRWQPARPSPQAPVLADKSHALPEGAAVISPVMFVGELSDPEFEAWLDLRQNPRDERIAF